MVTELFAERFVQEMRRRVVRHRRKTVTPRHDRTHTVADREAVTLEEQRLVVSRAHGANELRPRAGALVLDEARVRHLSPALRVERRLVELRAEATFLVRLEGRYRRQHLGLLVADEIGGRPFDRPHRLDGGSTRDLAVLAP